MSELRRKIGVLFVCTGNICRSPTADGVFKNLVQQANLEAYFEVDSAGTHAEVGWPPDKRSTEMAEKRGYSLEGITARQLVEADFERFDYLLAMDQGHQRYLQRMQREGSKGQVVLFLPFTLGPEASSDSVKDPYYGGSSDFVQVFDEIEAGCKQLLSKLQSKLEGLHL